MRKFRMTSTGLTLSLASVLALTFLIPVNAEERPSIFNGKDLSGWKAPSPNPFWQVVDGVLVGENDEKLTGHVLYTEKSYQDFVLELEVRWTGEIDSGVMLRKPELQLQFGISRSLKKEMSGSFYVASRKGYPESGRAKHTDRLLKTGEWNKFRLEAKGDTFTVWLNGEQVGQYVDAGFPGAAPIGLQIHPKLKMKVEFRNLRAKALD